MKKIIEYTKNGKIKINRPLTKSKIDKAFYTPATIKIVDCLLKGECISQLKNRCGVKRVASYIPNIRFLIGVEYLEAYRIYPNKRNEEYCLPIDQEKNKIAKQKLLELKNKILSKLQSKN